MGAIDALGLPESRWVDVGGPVHYREWEGPEDGPVFVLVHGLGGSHLNWVPVTSALGRRGRVVALDLAGFGLTPLAGRGAGIGSNWKLVDGFLQALALPPVVMVGNSMGGMITLIQSAQRPRSMSRMVLVDAAFPRGHLVRGPRYELRIAGIFALYDVGLIGAGLLERRTRRLGPEGLVRETLRLATADPDAIDPALVAAMVEMTRLRQDFGYAATAFLAAARSIFRAQIVPGRYRELVRRAATPALVLHGTKDRLVPVASAIETSSWHDTWRLEVMEGLGHLPQIEAPTQWLGLVDGWLDATATARAPRAPIG
jgi:pimeloyl-ACP methyl ester carboxylesterase